MWLGGVSQEKIDRKEVRPEKGKVREVLLREGK